mmetsp:Transcript_1730/g.4141  ORF Transcript_1730/g.4141 Transcript_1730/m.4141 type:complete len:552 (+) Transcript_1730:260-1915(+)
MDQIVPSVITSGYYPNDDSVSVITMNDGQTIATATPTLVNPNKRRRVMTVEPSLTEEASNAESSKQSSYDSRHSKTGKKQPPSPREATIASSFGVPIADFQACESSETQQRPTYEELSIELCKIVATVHYSRSEAIQALGNLCKWGYADDEVFLENMLELGGIQRVLIYLKNNKGDPLCVATAAKVVMACTYREPSQESFSAANGIVRALAKRDGFQILLDAGDQYGGENIASQLEGLRWVWAALMNTTDKSSAYEFRDPADEKQHLLDVFEFGLAAMAKLGKNVAPAKKTFETIPTVAANGADEMNRTNDNNNTEPLVHNSVSVARYDAYGNADYQLKAVQWIFSSLCGGGGSRKRAAMDTIVTKRKRITAPTPAKAGTRATTTKTKTARKVEVVDNSKVASLVMGVVFSTWLNIVHNSKMVVREDFLSFDLLRKCIGSLKTPDGQQWIGTKDLLIQASRFFVQCCEKDILSTANDFEIVFPLIVECIGKYPEASHHGGLFKFVKDAYSVVERSFLQGSGVVRAIATAWESDDVDKDTKNASHQLLKELL